MLCEGFFISIFNLGFFLTNPHQLTVESTGSKKHKYLKILNL